MCKHELPFAESDRQKSRLITPVFHRMGYYETFKINTEQFVDVKYDKDAWYQLDILLNWGSSETAFFINGKYRTTTKFYSFMRDEHLKGQCEDSQKVDTLSLYTLTPGVTSSFRQLRVCTQLCPELPEALKLYKGSEPSEALEDPLAIFESNSAQAMRAVDFFACLFIVLSYVAI